MKFKIITIVCTFALINSAFSDTVFFDGNWGASWSTASQFIEGPGASTQSASTVSSGGNPNAYWSQTTFYPAANPGTRNTIENDYLFSGAVYDPSVSGAILSLDFAIDFQKFSGVGQEDAAPVLRQGGVIYRTTFLSSSSTTWVNLSTTGLGSAAFGTPHNDPSGTGSLFTPGPAGLDFTSSGGPIEFGFGSAEGSSVGGSGNTLVTGYDNWTITLHTAPEPSTWAMLLGGIAVLVRLRRVRPRRTQGRNV